MNELLSSKTLPSGLAVCGFRSHQPLYCISSCSKYAAVIVLAGGLVVFVNKIERFAVCSWILYKISLLL